jgi:tetratricopeptide (TPR) repeat protein
VSCCSARFGVAPAEVKRISHSKKALIALLCSCLFGQSSNPLQDLMDDRHFKRARAVVESRYQEAPNDAETLYRLSWLRQVWGSLDEAQRFAERAVALAPKDARFHFQLAEVAGEKASKASVVQQIGLGRQFKKEADLTLRLDPKHIGAMKDMILFYLEAPGIIGGDKTKAREMALEIGKIDPVEGAIAEIQVAQRLKQEANVEELLRKAVAARPESYTGHVTLAGFLIGNKDCAGGEREAREAIRIRPGRAGGHGLLAVALVQQGRWADLDGALAAAEKAVPDDFMPFYRAAHQCLSHKVELPRAERYLRKYLTMEPEPDSPGLAIAHWQLGLVLEEMGRRVDAVRELESSLKADSGNARVKADLKRLRG